MLTSLTLVSAGRIFSEAQGYPTASEIYLSWCAIHPISLCNRYHHEIHSMSGPAPTVSISMSSITIHHLHRPESLRATLISPSFSPIICNHFPSSIHFVFKIISIFFVLSALPLTTTAVPTSFTSPLDTRNSMFTGLPECALQLTQNLYLFGFYVNIIISIYSMTSGFFGSTLCL